MAEIKARQEAYLEFFHDKGNVADLGCGRGEFVELLKERGIPVTGVDTSEEMIALCRERHLNVVKADALAYLQALPPASLDGIFAAQLVEHVPPGEIMRLVALCGEALAPGGVLVIETVNPLNALALANFYLDPAHVRPVHPHLLWFILVQERFTAQAASFSAPSSVSDEARITLAGGPPYNVTTHQDYAIIAIRGDNGAEA